MNDFFVFLATFLLLATAVVLFAASIILLINNRAAPEIRRPWRSALKQSLTLNLDPQKPLYRHLWFWIAALTPILIGISLGLPIWQKYSFSLSQSGYDTFLEISKLPLYVMAPAIPLGMVVAAFHKTKQTSAQLWFARKSDLDKKKEELFIYYHSLMLIKRLENRICFHWDLLSGKSSFSSQDLPVAISKNAAVISEIFDCLYSEKYTSVISIFNVEIQSIDARIFGFLGSGDILVNNGFSDENIGEMTSRNHSLFCGFQKELEDFYFLVEKRTLKYKESLDKEARFINSAW